MKTILFLKNFLSISNVPYAPIITDDVLMALTHVNGTAPRIKHRAYQKNSKFLYFARILSPQWKEANIIMIEKPRKSLTTQTFLTLK